MVIETGILVAFFLLQVLIIAACQIDPQLTPASPPESVESAVHPFGAAVEQTQ